MDIGEFYHFRCFLENVDRSALVEFLKAETDLLIVVYEESHMTHRPHIHATLRFPKAVNTFRDKFRKNFSQLFGNKSYSISKVRDYDSNIKYCCKGSANDYPEVLHTKLTQEEIKQYYTEYWEVKTKILKSKKEMNMGCQNDLSFNEVEVKVKTKSVTWSEKTTKFIISEYPLLCDMVCQFYEGLIDRSDYEKAQAKLVDIVMDRLGQTSKNLDEIVLIRLFNAQLNAIITQVGNEKSKTTFRQEIYTKVRSKLF